MFEQSRDKYKDNENKLLIAKVIDKYEFCKASARSEPGGRPRPAAAPRWWRGSRRRGRGAS